MRQMLAMMKSALKLDAIGIRIRDGEDFPYLTTLGFSQNFVEAENHLCNRDADGRVARNSRGEPILECLCGDVLCRRTDSLPTFFTRSGSFCTNRASRLPLPSRPEDAGPARYRCVKQGFDSLALIPLRSEGQIIGLLQVCAKGRDRFPPDTVRFLEAIVSSIAVAMARDRAETALRASEERFRLLATSSPVGIFHADGEGRGLYVNERICSFTGRPPKAHLGDGWAGVVHPEDRRRVLMAWRRAVAGRKDFNLEFRFVSPEGAVTWVSSAASRVSDDRGRTTCIIGTLTDITKRKESELALLDSEQRYRRVVTTSTDAIMIFDAETRQFVEVNKAAEELYGYTQNEFLSLKHDQVTAEPEASDESIRKTLSGQLDMVPIRYHRKKDGTVFPVEISASTFPVGGRKVVCGVLRDITERMTAEEALQQSRERFRTLTESTSDWIWEVDENGVYTYASPKVKELLGYELEEFVGKTPFDLMLPEDVERVRAAFSAAVDSKTPFQRLENANRHRDGHTVWLESSGVPIFDADGRFRGYRGIDRDITEPKKMQVALAESEQRFRAIFESASDGILMADAETRRFAAANEAICQMLGYGQTELLTKTVSDIHRKEDLPFVVEQFERQARGEIVVAPDIPMLRKDGGLFYADVAAAPFTLGGSKYLLGTFRDNTERRQAEETLRRDATRLEILHEVDEAILAAQSLRAIATAALRHLPALVDCSRASVVQFNFETDAFTVLGAYEDEPGLGPPPGADIPLSAYGDIDDLKEGKTRIVEDVLLLSVIPEKFQSLSRSGLRSLLNVPLMAEGILLGTLNLSSRNPSAFGEETAEIANELAEVMALAMRHTNLHDEVVRRANELEQRVADRTLELEEINSELESFSYSISHDLRAPLRAISGYCGILLDEHIQQLDDEGKRLLQIVSDNAANMGELIRDLMAFSRASRQEIEMRDVDMMALARAAFDQVTSGQPQLSVQFNLTELPPAHADPPMIRQVLVNLLSNALKFTRNEKQPVIEMGGRTGANQSVYYVKDNGVGFEMEQRAKLFRVFQRLHSTRDFEGTGAGLAIVQRIVHRHGGRVSATAEPGVGATFHFSLPRSG